MSFKMITRPLFQKLFLKEFLLFQMVTRLFETVANFFRIYYEVISTSRVKKRNLCTVLTGLNNVAHPSLLNILLLTLHKIVNKVDRLNGELKNGELRGRVMNWES